MLTVGYWNYNVTNTRHRASLTLYNWPRIMNRNHSIRRQLEISNISAAVDCDSVDNRYIYVNTVSRPHTSAKHIYGRYAIHIRHLANVDEKYTVMEIKMAAISPYWVAWTLKFNTSPQSCKVWWKLLDNFSPNLVHGKKLKISRQTNAAGYITSGMAKVMKA